MTPLASEADNLLQREAKAHRDAEDAKKSFEELSKRAWQDEEEAPKVQREQDELC